MPEVLDRPTEVLRLRPAARPAYRPSPLREPAAPPAPAPAPQPRAVAAPITPEQELWSPAALLYATILITVAGFIALGFVATLINAIIISLNGGR